MDVATLTAMEADATEEGALEEALTQTVLSTGDEFTVSSVVGEIRWTEYEAPPASVIPHFIVPTEIEQADPD